MNSRRPAANHLELTGDLLAIAARALIEQLPPEQVSSAPYRQLSRALRKYEMARGGAAHWMEPTDCSTCKHFGRCDHANGEDCFEPVTPIPSGVR